MKVSSMPIGSCTATGLASSLSSIIFMHRLKFAPTRSILFTKQIRGTS